MQFVKDYAAAGLRDKLPLCGSGFLTEGVLKPQGAAAEGIQTALHYGDGLDNAKNTAFRAAFKQKTGRDADVYAVQGYDAGQMLAIGLDATKGDAAAIKPMAAAIRAAKIDSPRGAFTLVAVAQPGADDLSARGEGRREPRDRRRGGRAGRSRHRLQDERLTG